MHPVSQNKYLFLVALCLCTVYLYALTAIKTQVSSTHLAIHFLDVGQGDAILIQTPEGYEALIDGGRGRGVLRELAKQQAWFDRHIDIVVATHPDEDHVGGLVDVLNQYDVDLLLVTEAQSDSPGAAAFSAAVAAENAAVVQARSGQTITLGASTTIEVLAPASDTSNWSTNAASIIVKITYGETEVLLTGDAPQNIENYLVKKYGTDLQADILKLGHHGSKTSTGGEFLDAVMPQYAVVSAGIDNSYGHPHQEVMQRVFQRNITTFHTGADGTVSFYSDGDTIWK